MRHALGVLGVLAAGVLLVVSAAMNWRFGYTLGVSEVDKLIYGSASAAADCFKALIPFFLLAAIRNKMWSQAMASGVIWVIVTAYSLTSALGHAALNRTFTTGERAVQAAAYKDLRSDLKRAQDQLSWVPQHRPAATVSAEMESLRLQRLWTVTKGCTSVTGPQGRGLCQQYQALNAELGSAHQAEKLNGEITTINAKLSEANGASAASEADPQAAVLAKLAGAFGFSLKTEDMQTALAVFIALLLEIGSGFGMYVAFAAWRVDRSFAAIPRAVARGGAAEVPSVRELPMPALSTSVEQPLRPAAANEEPAAVAVVPQRFGVANDNRSTPRLTAPQTDVERFYQERMEVTDRDTDSITASEVYEDYIAWCEQQYKEPLAMPSFGRELTASGVRKHRIGGRIRYQGIRLKTASRATEDKNSPALRAA